MKIKIVVALAGNPNSGKTTIFNALTGAHQHVGNYPGVTVERKEGFRYYGDIELQIVDLPGTYSLSAYSAEELVARNFIIDEKPDVVVDIIDTSNLERNLYLAVQFMELGVPLVLAFNMSDMAKARGYEFDIDKLSGFFGTAIVRTVGHKGTGIKELIDAVISTATKGVSKYTDNRETSSASPLSSGASILGPQCEAPVLNYGANIEREIAKIQSLSETKGYFNGKYDSRWLALKLLENDRELRGKVVSPQLDEQIEKSVSRIEQIIGKSPEVAIAERRYGFISGACQESVRSTIEFRHTLSDRIDSLLTNRILGIPVFLGLMYLVFQLTFTLGNPPMEWIEEASAGWAA